MFLYYFALGVDDSLVSHEDLFGYRFPFNVRFVSNYLSRMVRKRKIQTGGPYTMIYVNLNHEDQYKESEGFHTMTVDLQTDKSQLMKYSSLTKLEDRYEWYLSCFEKGYKVIAANRNISFGELLSMNDCFRENDYRNEWIFNKVRVKDYGLYIFLKCYFTTFDFRLELEAYDLKLSVLKIRGVIFRTMPHEFFFSKEFRNTEIRGNLLIIKDFLNHNRFEIRLDYLADGVFILTDKGSLPSYESALKKISW